MKIRTGIVALALAGMSMAGVAQAFPGGHCQRMGSGEKMEAFAASRLEKLHAALKLAPEQESAWATWSASVRGRISELQQHRPDPASLAKLTAPERMEWMLGRMKERQKDMEAGLASLKTFYATLTPEQRQIFDKHTPFGERRGRGNRGSPASEGRIEP